jgi:hypothetical protein
LHGLNQANSLVKNEKKALHCYEASAALNYGPAQSQLAEISFYDKGGLRRDEDKALKYFRLSADNVDSQTEQYGNVLWDLAWQGMQRMSTKQHCITTLLQAKAFLQLRTTLLLFMSERVPNGVRGRHWPDTSSVIVVDCDAKAEVTLKGRRVALFMSTCRNWAVDWPS